MKSKLKYGPWFRAYAEAVDDPKIQKLSDKLGFFWFNCLCLACQNGGMLPPIPHIAWKLRKAEKIIAAMLAELYEHGLLEREGDTFTPHNWTLRQFDSDVSTDRVRRFRDQKRSDSALPNTPHETPDETFPKRRETVSETVPDTDTDTDTDTETHTEVPPRACVSMPRAADLSGQVSQRFEEFWTLYPRKLNRDRAGGEWVSVVTVDVERRVLACLHEYLQSSEVSRGVVMNPDKWLREQYRNKWGGGWPRAPPPQGQIPKKSHTKEMIDSL